MKLKIKDAVIAKEILNKDICNSIMYIAKEEGRDADGDILHTVGGYYYYVHLIRKQVAEIYKTTIIDNILHIGSIISYLLIDIIAIILVYYISWDMLHQLIFNEISTDFIKDSVYLIFLLLATKYMRLYLTSRGIVSGYVKYSNPDKACKNIFIMQGITIVLRKVITPFLIIAIFVQNYILYGFGIHILFYMQIPIAFYAMTKCIYNIECLFAPSTLNVSVQFLHNKRYAKALYIMNYGRAAINKI